MLIGLAGWPIKRSVWSTLGRLLLTPTLLRHLVYRLTGALEAAGVDRRALLTLQGQAQDLQSKPQEYLSSARLAWRAKDRASPGPLWVGTLGNIFSLDGNYLKEKACLPKGAVRKYDSRSTEGDTLSGLSPQETPVAITQTESEWPGKGQLGQGGVCVLEKFRAGKV